MEDGVATAAAPLLFCPLFIPLPTFVFEFLEFFKILERFFENF